MIEMLRFTGTLDHQPSTRLYEEQTPGGMSLWEGANELPICVTKSDTVRVMIPLDTRLHPREEGWLSASTLSLCGRDLEYAGTEGGACPPEEFSTLGKHITKRGDKTCFSMRTLDTHSTEREQPAFP